MALQGVVDAAAVIVGLPRGGVPVAAEIAAALGAPLDVIIVRKLGVPFQPELAMGAVGEDGVRVRNDTVVRSAHVAEDAFDQAVVAQLPEVARMARHYRQGRPRESLVGRTVVVVDDGLATGATARAACLIARSHGADRVVLAVPVAPRRTLAKLVDVTDEIVCLAAPDAFSAVGQFYRSFGPTSDAEVVALLGSAAARAHGGGADAPGEDPRR